MVRTAFEMGRGGARSEIAKAREKHHAAAVYVVKMPPKAIIKQMEKARFWIKNVVFDGLKKKIQGLLINAYETGETPNETALKVREAYNPYIGDIQRVKDQKQIEPYRIETLVRTNTTKAYNRGKVVEFADPELEGFVRAVQLSAILDTRTTDICRGADGKIIMLDDDETVKRLTPPLHFNCRSVLVPVTEIDGEFEPASASEVEGVKSDMPPDFGGNWD
jgi:SPP1 gp7 family putative phage head morphogenesis protein